MLPQGNTHYVKGFFIYHDATALITPHGNTYHIPGDIEVFKDMAIEKLDLSQCQELTGEWVKISKLEISDVAPQGNTQLQRTMHNIRIHRY